MNEREILQTIKNAYSLILADNLTGIYVHGSIAFGCFNWEKSDIDFLVVVNQSPTLEEKKALIQSLLTLDEFCPKKGLEMSVILENVCREFQYPTPYELHFSNDHKERCKADVEAYCRSTNGVDKDLAAHFTVTRNVGITLCGKPVEDVFGMVPKEAYRDSLRYDIENAENDILDNPVYIILNLCRVLAYIREEKVLSKKQGGEWGITHLPPRYRAVVQAAIGSYCGKTSFTIDEAEAKAFAKYMLEQIL